MSFKGAVRGVSFADTDYLILASDVKFLRTLFLLVRGCIASEHVSWVRREMEGEQVMCRGPSPLVPTACTVGCRGLTLALALFQHAHAGMRMQAAGHLLL
jgi:hypothetical protein